ncbi:hypothetical protein [Wohlfahrtiimonas populi]|uniref:hypothetical protein n=1 Tax=Wohlfahrtiimonas populi TaxID=1940240 RepID=UPI00098CF73B|nr:hypothetical protein [Wohlfahrtiimonas populi]
MQPITTLECASIAPYRSIYSEDSANAQSHIYFIKEINQAHTFDRFTLGLIQEQFCSTIFTDSFSKEKTK